MRASRFRGRVVETTSRSPHGESVLQRGKGLFLGEASASRRTCARRDIFTLAERGTCITLACCGRARSSCLWGISEHNKRDGKRRPFCYVGGDNKSFASRRKRLAKGKGLFWGEASASRRTCAHGAYDTPYMCGNGNENTSRVYGRFAR